MKAERSNLTIREDKKRGVFVEGLSEWVVRSPAEIYGLMERGGHVRATGETKMNEFSSRSHAVFIVIAEQSQTMYVDEKGEEVNDIPQHLHQSRSSLIIRLLKYCLVDIQCRSRVRISVVLCYTVSCVM